MSHVSRDLHQRATERRTARHERWSSREAAARARHQIDQAANNRVVGAVLISLGANWLLMELGLFPFGFMGLLAIALAVLGAGLIGTAKAGSSPKLAVLGIIMTGVLAMSSGVTNPIQGHFAGDRTIVPTSAADLDPSYSQTLGDFTLDLSRVDFETGIKYVEVETAVGDLEVIVPADVAVEVTANVGVAGEILLLDTAVRDALGSVSHQYTDRSWNEAQERLSLRLDSKVGDIVVRRES